MNGRRNVQPGDVLSFGPFSLFVAGRLLKTADEMIPLGGRALDVLIALTERAGEVVSYRELISIAWPNVTVDEANLRVQIATLRKALGGEDGARYISNVAGRGYCFVAPVTRSQEPTAKAEGIAGSEQSWRLPPRLARMVGRDEAVRAVSEQLLTGRFVSIVGPGGIGKTTVAVSVAHALVAGFGGAVSFVDLSALTKPQFVPTAVASALGFMIQANDPFGSLVAFVGEKKVLLVLDNCEHVIDSAAVLAERIVSEAPQAHILTTSREALRVEGERVHLLHSLDCPPEHANLTAAEVLRYPAAQLFMERATAGGYCAALIDIDAPVVATICRRLDGIALAIELAASGAGYLGIRGIAELLDNRFSLLWHGRRTALPRHQTLNAMLDWSYNLLPEHERAVLSKLSVFVGDFTIEAACSVASEKETDQASSTDALESLLVKSLISTSSATGPTYYRLLDTTGAYARARLIERGEANRAARRHANFFSRFLQHDEIVQSRFGERDLSGYASHVGNVRAALEWAFSDGGDVAVGMELATWAAPLFIGLSLLEECKRWCERALACLNDAVRGTRQEMILQEALALSSMFTQGDVDQVRAAIERGLVLEEMFGDRRHQLQLLYGLYRLLMRLGDFRGALEAAQKTAIFAEGDPTGMVVADFMLGTCYHFIGDQAAAQLYGERGMARAVKPGTVIPNFFGFDHRIYAPISLARTLWLRGFSDQARSLARKAVDGALGQDNPLSTCVALTYGSAVFIWSGDLQIAGDYVERLVEYAGRHSIEPYRAAGLGLRGVLAIARDDVVFGVDLLRSAVGTLSAKKLNVQLTPFAGALAEGLRMTGHVEEALLTVNGAIARTAGCGSTFDMPELLRIKAEILAATPQLSRASVVNCLNEAIEAARVQSALALELRSTITLARLLSEAGQPDQARRELALVYDRFTEGFQTDDLRRARTLLEDLELRS
ncbi:putative ATPase/DNA-binding winged helix-turn-helix (wHTH) protein [Bradyrhizobium sp. AZCC 2262]|uniref:ATP-binding protein n=1 Tax=Bradyrhizobium sp. AZCC 2262 TaxID=3117022 RepID=UPI002FF28F9E